jgi:hypothetical protein
MLSTALRIARVSALLRVITYSPLRLKWILIRRLRGSDPCSHLSYMVYFQRIFRTNKVTTLSRTSNPSKNNIMNPKLNRNPILIWSWLPWMKSKWVLLTSSNRRTQHFRSAICSDHLSSMAPRMTPVHHRSLTNLSAASIISLLTLKTSRQITVKRNPRSAKMRTWQTK